MKPPPHDPVILNVDDTDAARYAKTRIHRGKIPTTTEVEAARAKGKAQALGQYEVFHGDHRKLFEAPSRFDGVTVAQIQALAG